MPSSTLSEPFLLALDSLMERGALAGLLRPEAFVSPGTISDEKAYQLHLAACRIVVEQDAGTLEQVHQLINLQFPITSPWCPVYVPPACAGTYLLAHAYAPHMPVGALYRPARGFVWGRWYPPSGKHIALPLLPGDRWRLV